VRACEQRREFTLGCGCALHAQNPEVQKRMIAMQDDPDMKEFFDAVKVRRWRGSGRFWASCRDLALSRALLSSRALRRRAALRR
jgi:hypothetical protein